MAPGKKKHGVKIYEKACLMHVYMSNGLPHLIYGYPSKVFETLAILKGIETAVKAIRVL